MRGVRLVALLGSVVALAPPVGGAEPARPAGTLALSGVLATTTYRGDYCPPGSPVSLSCFKRDGAGVIRGLGAVSSSYVYAHDGSDCPLGDVRFPALGAVRLVVAGKGTIDVAVDAIPGCSPEVQNVRPPRSFTVTGGSGAYAGATGGGRLREVIFFANVSTGTDTWEGTITVPQLEFDVAPPRLIGASSRVVRVPRGARRVRVTYRVMATDAVDGALPTACSPPSGTAFRIGRTRVMCSAMDTSGNTGVARFVVTVRPARR